MKGEWGLSAPCSPISALPLRRPPAGLSCEIFRRELAITELDWSFAPSPRSWERIARQHPFGPPPGFRPASPYPGLDHSVSSIIPVIPDPFRSRPSRPFGRCGHVGFPTASGFEALNLTTEMNSPARATRRIVGPWSPPDVLPRRRGFLLGGSTLSGPTRTWPPDFRHFSPPFRGTFQLSLTVLVRYRSWDVFSLGSCFLPASSARTEAEYSRIPVQILPDCAYGALTL